MQMFEGLSNSLINFQIAQWYELIKELEAVLTAHQKKQQKKTQKWKTKTERTKKKKRKGNVMTKEKKIKQTTLKKSV